MVIFDFVFMHWWVITMFVALIIGSRNFIKVYGIKAYIMLFIGVSGMFSFVYWIIGG